MEDRISALPDVIIHKILALLQFPFQRSKLSLLSKRWNQVWRSYPTLEFYHVFPRWKGHSPEKFSSASASCKKFFRQRISDASSPPEAVRIVTRTNLCPSEDDFLGELLDLTAELSPQEILIRASFRPALCKIPRRFFLDHTHSRLKVLKLEHCDFGLYSDLGMENPFAGLVSSLKVLHLEDCIFPDERILNSMIAGASLLENLKLRSIDNLNLGRLEISSIENLKVLHLEGVTFTNDGILHSMIAGASRLEKLTLGSIRGITRVQVLNHHNLKAVEAVVNFECFEIIGACSLESLSFNNRTWGYLEISYLGNLKVLHLDRVAFRDDTVLNNMIADAPLLEDLTLGSIKGIDRFQVLNHHSLKAIKSVAAFECFEIIGVPSLESLSFRNPVLGYFEISSLGNLRVLDIESVWNWTEENVSRLHISEYPSLESLTLKHVSGRREVRIVFGDYRLWEAKLFWGSYIIEIDGSSLASLDSFISKLLKSDSFSEATSRELKQFLNELSQFRLEITSVGQLVHT